MRRFIKFFKFRILAKFFFFTVFKISDYQGGFFSKGLQILVQMYNVTPETKVMRQL